MVTKPLMLIGDLLIVSIQEAVHSGWCSVEMMSIRDCVHSGWFPFRMVSIWDGVRIPKKSFAIENSVTTTA